MRHFGGDPRRPLRPVLNPVLDGWSCASRSCCREATYGHCGARERTRLGSRVRSADVEDSGPVDFQWGCRSCGVRRDHRIGHGRSGPVPKSDRPAGQGRCGFSPWGGCCAIRSQTRIDPVHVVSDTAPREVMQMPLAVQFLSSRPGTPGRRMRLRTRRRVLLSMALTGGLMLLGPSVLGMSGSLALAAPPVASVSSFDAASQSYWHPPILRCPHFDC